jgi:hypothetical protein
MVYDLLITRSHHPLTWILEGGTSHLTLVMADQIPPVNLTCNQLHAEAGPYLQAKVERMSLRRSTPRLIFDYSTSIRLLLDSAGLLNDLLW